MGKVLKQVFERDEISQYGLTVMMNVEVNNIYRWVNGKT